jgi:hypothetical protein
VIHRWRMRRALLAFHEGELTGKKRFALELHRERCPACDAVLRRLVETDRLLAAARPETAALSPDSAQCVLERALAGAGTPRRSAWRPAVAAGGLALALAIALAAAIGPAWVSGPPLRRPPAEMTIVPAPPDTVGSLADPGAQRRRQQRPAAVDGARQAARPEEATPAAERSRVRKRRHHKPRRRSAVICRRGAPVSALRLGEKVPTGPAASSNGPSPESRWEPAEIVDCEQLAQSEPQPAGQMLVMLTAGHVEDLVTARQAPEETPGYARAAALRPDASGELIWTQAIVSSAQPATVLALRTLADEDRDP